MNRRDSLKAMAATALAVPMALGNDGPPRRRFTMDIVPGMLGVNVPWPEAFALAAANGFESIAPDASYLGGLDDEGLAKLLEEMKAKGVAFGAAGLGADFRKDEKTFAQGRAGLPAFGAALKRAGVTRVGTWLKPSHAELTYLANFKLHVARLRAVAEALGEHGLRFGLEYVGPKTSWTAERHPFVHTIAEARELIAAIDRPNVGLVLDSWHWYTAGDSEADLLALTDEQVVACDLNDAPAGLSVDRQMDLSRELPGATGVIDLKTFLRALATMGYTGPVRAEPFNAALRKLPPAEAVATTAAAMKKAFALVGG